MYFKPDEKKQTSKIWKSKPSLASFKDLNYNVCLNNNISSSDFDFLLCL